MKRFFVTLLSLSILTFVLAIPSFADSSISVTGYNNILSWSLTDDPDDGVESLDVQFSAYGSNSWVVVDTVPSQDLTSVTSYIIPDNLYSQGNRFRVAISTPNGIRYSSVYSITDSFFSNFTLRYDEDTHHFYVSTASPSAITLHFQYLGTATDYPASFPDITIPAYTDSIRYDYCYAVSSGGVPQIIVPPHDCLVYATTVISGVTYSSNIIRLYGFVHSADISLPEVTDVVIPNDTDIAYYTNIIYSPVLETPVFKYCASACACIFPLIFMAFVYRKLVV